jgi:hypothetical protein
MSGETIDTEVRVIDRRNDYSVTESAQTESSNDLMIITAMQKGYSPELIEKMMDLQERMEKREAEKAFVMAMSEFKKNPPEILKTAHVSYKTKAGAVVKWDHAELGEITEAIINGLAPHNIYHRWTREVKDGLIYVTCKLTHAFGHSEEVTMEGPPDLSGDKDALKAASSTNTFLQRLTLLAVTGLAAKGMDNENPGDDTKTEYITDAQVKEIKQIIEEKNIDMVPFFKWAKVSKIEDITVKAFKEVMDKLKAAKGRPKTISCPRSEGRDVPLTDCPVCPERKGCPSHDNN